VAEEEREDRIKFAEDEMDADEVRGIDDGVEIPAISERQRDYVHLDDAGDGKAAQLVQKANPRSRTGHATGSRGPWSAAAECAHGPIPTANGRTLWYYNTATP